MIGNAWLVGMTRKAATDGTSAPQKWWLRRQSWQSAFVHCHSVSYSYRKNYNKIQQSQKNASLRYFAQPLSPWPALLTLMSSNSQHLEPHCQAIWHAVPWAWHVFQLCNTLTTKCDKHIKAYETALWSRRNQTHCRHPDIPQKCESWVMQSSLNLGGTLLSVCNVFWLKVWTVAFGRQETLVSSQASV